MSHLDTLLDRNRRFAATDAKDHVPAIPFVPHRQAYLVTCIDPRVDPAAVLGVGLGDAIVARTVGGRVSADVLRDLAWICHLHREKTPDAGWFELAVVHHTDCGSGLLADDELRRDFAARIGADEGELARLAVVDPARTVTEDVRTLLASPGLAPQVAVSGWTYDVRTGLATPVVGPRSRAAESVTAAPA
jgi:carbonic anhydrase